MANSAYGSWLGFLMPSKVPRDIVNRLYAETSKVLGSSDVKDRLAKIGAEPLITAPEDFDCLIKSDLASNERVIRAVGIKME